MLESNEQLNYGNSTKKLQPKTVIKCPHCGYEYLPCEIFYPDNVLGKSDNVIRDPLGKIIYEDYKEDCEPLAEETFICENCNKPFIAEVELKVKTRAQEEELDFSNLTTSLF